MKSPTLSRAAVDDLVRPSLPSGGAIAVSCLRVSTKEQAEKGGTEEGYSIPAQREENRRKAEQLGATVIEEFVDAGESARKADRPELIRMIKYVAEHQVNYCIVHKVDRLARNRADDVAIHLALRDAGVMLVSASENIDETPSGMLLHGIMSSIAKFYSRNLATETVKGLTQKAAQGGTPNRAPIGYVNIGVRDERGRENRTVQVDEERAPHITWAFQVYASGRWTLSQLHRELIARGLTTLPTPKRPSKPIAISTLHRLLTNPYYKGDVTFKGATHKGTHEAIVPKEVWYQVQSVLDAHKSAADATQVHDHYLKGTVYCGQCGERLIITNAKNRHGNVYPYFVCSGRHSGKTECTRQAMLIEDVERLIENYYEMIELSPGLRQDLAGKIHADFDALMANETKELSRLTNERDRLDDERMKLLQAHYAGAVPIDLLKQEQDRIANQIGDIQHRLEANHDEYASARANLDDSLGLLANIVSIYQRSDDANRRLCNQAFFHRIFIEEEGDVRVEYETPFGALCDTEEQMNALNWAAEAKKQGEVQTGQRVVTLVEGLNLSHLGSLLGTFSNLAPRMKPLIKRWQRGTYNTSRRSETARIYDERGQVVHKLGNPQTFLSPSKVVQVVKEYQGGSNVGTLAEELGVHRSTISRCLNREGICRRPPGLGVDEAAEAVRLHQNGMSLREIAKVMGVGRKLVTRAVVEG